MDRRALLVGSLAVGATAVIPNVASADEIIDFTNWPISFLGQSNEVRDMLMGIWYRAVKEGVLFHFDPITFEPSAINITSDMAIAHHGWPFVQKWTAGSRSWIKETIHVPRVHGYVTRTSRRSKSIPVEDILATIRVTLVPHYSKRGFTLVRSTRPGGNPEEDWKTKWIDTSFKST